MNDFPSPDMFFATSRYVLDAIMTASTDQVFVLDRIGRFVDASLSGAQALGMDRAALIGKTWLEVGAPRDAAALFDSQRTEIFVTERAVVGSIRYPTARGERDYEYTLTPIRSDNGSVEAVLFTGVDVEDRNRREREYKTVEQAVRARAEREVLLSHIGQAALWSPDPAALQSTALSLLGKRLEVDRCFYVLYDEDRNIARIEKDWCRDGVPSLEGEWDLTERGTHIRDIYAGGRTEVVDDVAAVPLSPSLVKLFLETGQRSYVAAPFFDQRRPVAALTVMMASAARTWSEEEVALVEAAAVRIRGAVEAVRAAQRERKAQERQRVFLRDVLTSVTEGRLILCDTLADLPSPLAPVGHPVSLSREDGLRGLRRLVMGAVEGMAETRKHDLVTAVSEAGMNAIIHGGGKGTGWVAIGADGTVQVRVEDQGVGIALESLPKATLARGFSTKASLGHGFKMMQQVDKVYVLTGSTGTTLVLEHGLEEQPPEWLRELHI